MSRSPIPFVTLETKGSPGRQTASEIASRGTSSLPPSFRPSGPCSIIHSMRSFIHFADDYVLLSHLSRIFGFLRTDSKCISTRASFFDPKAELNQGQTEPNQSRGESQNANPSNQTEPKEKLAKSHNLPYVTN